MKTQRWAVRLVGLCTAQSSAQHKAALWQQELPASCSTKRSTFYPYSGTLGLWAQHHYAHSMAVVNVQGLCSAAHSTGPGPLLSPGEGTHWGNIPFPKDSLRVAGCQGMSICRAPVWRMETDCQADATSKANASPDAVIGTCRGNHTFLFLQPATVIPLALCPSPSVILPRESASASGSPQDDDVKNALYVLSFCYHFCMCFQKSSLPSLTRKSNN